MPKSPETVMEPSMRRRDLDRSVLRSTAWYGASRVWINAVSWSVTILLARLLSPEDYGLFAIAVTVVAFLELFQEFGLGTAIIQEREVTREQLNAVFWVIVAASVALTSATFIAAPVVATFYGDARLVGIVRVLGLTFVVNAIGVVPYNLLTKRLDFRRRSIADSGSVVVSAAIALTVAVLGHGIWALVLGHVGRFLTLNLALAIFGGWRPSGAASFHGIGALMAFGVRMAGTNVLVALGTALNTMIVGRFLGGHAVGLYTLAEGLSTAPHRITSAVINQISLPVFSRLQADVPELRRYFLKISKYLAVVAFPVQLAMAMLAHDLVSLLLGQQWTPMVPAFQVFSVGGILYIVTLPTSPLLAARGKARLLFRWSWKYILLLTAAFLVGAQWGLVAVALAWLLAFSAVRLHMVSLTLVELGLTARAYLRTIALPSAAMTAMSVALVATTAIAPFGPGSVGRVAVGILAGTLTYLAALLLLDRTLVVDVEALIRTVWAEPVVTEVGHAESTG